MPLSEHEQQLLEEMERALYAEDPKFASQMKGRRQAGPPRTRLLLGLGIAVLGLAAVVAALVVEQIWIGGVGFAIMVAGVAWAFSTGPTTLTDTSTGKTHTARRTPRAKQKSTGNGSFVQRMEGRWEERRRGDGL